MNFRFSFILFRKRERGARKLRSRYWQFENYRVYAVYVDPHTYAIFSTLPFIPLPLDTLPYQTLSQFSAPSHLRTHVSPPWQHASLPLALTQHRKHTSTHVLHSRTVCCQTVRDRSRRANATITPNRYLSTRHTLVSKISSSGGETRSSVGKDHSTRISPFARITVQPTSVLPIFLRGHYARDASLAACWRRTTPIAYSITLGTTSRDFSWWFPSERKETDGGTDRWTDERNGRKRAGWYENEEEDGVVAGWLAGPPAGSGRALV